MISIRLYDFRRLPVQTGRRFFQPVSRNEVFHHKKVLPHLLVMDNESYILSCHPERSEGSYEDSSSLRSSE